MTLLVIALILLAMFGCLAQTTGLSMVRGGNARQLLALSALPSAGFITVIFMLIGIYLDKKIR